MVSWTRGVALSLLCSVASAQSELDRWIDALESSSTRAAAQVELLRSGALAAKPLARALTTRFAIDPVDEAACAAAARVLGDLGAAAVGAFDILSNEVLHPYATQHLRHHCGYALSRIGPFARSDDRAELLARVADNRKMRRAFGGMWHELGSSLAFDAVNSTPRELLDALSEENPYARATACRALRARIGEFPGSARSQIRDALRAAITEPWEPRTLKWHVRRQAMQWSSSRGLVRWLRTESSLALLSYDAEDPLGFLGACQRLYDLDPTVRIAAARWLAKRRNPEAVRWLLEAGWNAPAEVTFACLAAVERIGPSVRFEARRLTAYLDHPDTEVAAAAERIARSVLPFERPVEIQARLELVGAGRDKNGRRGLGVERAKLIAWLDRDGGRFRNELILDPNRIDQYDPQAEQHVRWVPARVPPSAWRPGYWEESWARVIPDVVDAAPASAMGPARERRTSHPYVVELIPVERRDPVVTHQDLDTLRCYDQSGGPSLQCRLAADARLERYVDFCGELAAREGGHLLCLGDGLVVGWAAVDDAFVQWRTRDPWFQIINGTEDRWDMLRRLATQ